VLCGIAAAIFVWLLHFMEDLFDDMPGNAYSRNIVGMLALGILFYAIFRGLGHYHVEGVGYSTVQAILGGQMNVAWLLLLLFAAKLLATTLSLASGSSGGVFSPSLFLGATLGGSFGALVSYLWPGLGLNAVPFAIVGMAAMVGGGAGASMTAILMIFEMTRDYSVTVPAIIAVASALGMRRVLTVENIYTMKLARRGHYIPKERHSHMFLIRHARDVMTRIAGVTRLDELAVTPERRAVPGAARAFRVVADGRHVVGVIAADEDGSCIDGAPLLRSFIIARHDDFLQAVIRRMNRHAAPIAIVVDTKRVPRPENVIGVITPNEIAGTVMRDFAR
jgi:CIC family chloride channel protein